MLVACAPPAPVEISPPDTRAADEAAIRKAAQDWDAAGQAKDLDRFMAFYADDAVLMLEASPDFTGKPAIREVFGAMMQDPNFKLTFSTLDVVVARAGDLAYETGRYDFTISDANQQPARQIGHSVVVWRKQADGAWKVVVDSPSSDPSPAATQ
jgi:uncharacterized protein (TIGR02246 family)